MVICKASVSLSLRPWLGLLFGVMGSIPGYPGLFCCLLSSTTSAAVLKSFQLLSCSYLLKASLAFIIFSLHLLSWRFSEGCRGLSGLFDPGHLLGSMIAPCCVSLPASLMSCSLNIRNTHYGL